MAKFTADQYDVEGTNVFFQSCEGFEHLRSRRRGALLTIISGPDDDPIIHARLRRVTKQWWELEVPTSTGRWERTGLRGNRIDVIDRVMSDMEWLLVPRE